MGGKQRRRSGRRERRTQHQRSRAGVPAIRCYSRRFLFGTAVERAIWYARVAKPWTATRRSATDRPLLAAAETWRRVRREAIRVQSTVAFAPHLHRDGKARGELGSLSTSRSRHEESRSNLGIGIPSSSVVTACYPGFQA